jgi:hypothetical protein
MGMISTYISLYYHPEEQDYEENSFGIIREGIST